MGTQKNNYSPSEKSVIREVRHEHAIRELCRARQGQEDEEGVDEF